MLKLTFLAAVLCPLLSANAATVLPLAPFTFSNNASYDANFKEPSSNNGVIRNAAGYLQLQGTQFGIAIFDTSATGGVAGLGGTSGHDDNNDLSNFTISASLASSESGGIGGGFLLRLDSGEENGYFASVLTLGTDAVKFDLAAGAGAVSGPGFNIFSITLPLNNLTIATNTFYPFKVEVNDGTFSFDFGSGAATASFTDPFPSATVGQVGFVLTTISPTAATRLDNFTITPEPNSAAFLCAAAAVVIMIRPRRSALESFQ